MSLDEIEKEEGSLKSDHKKYCRACGTENGLENKFCKECGGQEFVGSKKEYESLKIEKQREKEEDEKLKKAYEEKERVLLEKIKRLEQEKAARDATKAAKEAEFFASIHVDDVVEGKKVLRIDEETKKGCIGYKQLQPQPWDLAAEKYAEGDVIHGKVVRIVQFGAFVEVEKGIDGLVHFSQITHESLENPTKTLTIGQEVDAKILKLDCLEKKMILSIKALNSPNQYGEIKSKNEKQDSGDEVQDFEIENGILKKYKGKGGDVIIPNNVTSIGDGAFNSCLNLISITIPNKITHIGKRVFENCSNLAKIDVEEGNTRYKAINNILYLYTNDGRNLIRYAPRKKDKTFIVPNNVMRISKGAFEEVSNLTSITIPNSVKSIGDFAFSGCDNLTIYIKANNKPNGWAKDWNSDGCPVVWGYKEAREQNKDLSTHFAVIGEDKKQIVEEIKVKIQSSKSVILADYNKLTVLEVTALRNKFKEANCEYKVYNNVLVRRAFNELGITDFDGELNGTTATVFCADATSGVAVFEREVKANPALAEKIIPKCAYVENKYLDQSSVKALSAIPSKEVLIAKMLGYFRFPLFKCVNVLKQIAKVKENN